MPQAERYVVYADALCREKGEVLAAAGFACTATHAQRAAADRARQQWVDVEVWETRLANFDAV